MFRDRTNLFLSYRRTVPRLEAPGARRTVSLAEEEESLMSARRSMNGPRNLNSYRDDASRPNEIEMRPLAPSIFEISSLLDTNLAAIRQKTTELSLLYKKLLITRDSEKKPLEDGIDGLNYNITRMFEACYVLIKKFEFIQKNHVRLRLAYSADELSILENYKKTYALKIQDSLLVFRNLQNNYIKFLKDDDDDDDSHNLLLSSASQHIPLEEEDSRDIEDYSRQALRQAQQQIQQDPNSQLMASREREISKLAMGILEISTIFKEMENLVVDQGSMLDRIDYNIGRTAEDLRASDKELVRAQGHQKRTTKCKIIFLLCLVVLALFMVVMIRPSRKTTVVEKPSLGAGTPGQSGPQSRPTKQAGAPAP
ncbi:t-SNARE [Metschnikowia bicuspidata var. bicuspidata NRRL YB-4993]|uniref:t-SNARE n=1 Tax=Metschnikowia bicuspidata var. bicuspidata NRRL YB-4993 TaxID=869754 RepID=A0A1A0HJG1_9ASCO|nr:t-SNARE [Metschnikowia bicuspidata var. bicuspidata NRRL YB-4993]OBA24136.1 t-SNARE [Metschnikowia bicuspidata var. bicuspidata NRRL YB-4993]